MKPIIPSALLGALLVGVASAATTTPVGYETLSLQSGFNYLGLRLHQASAAAGTLEVTGGVVQDTGANFSALSANPTTLYLLELNNGSGIVTEFLGSNVTGDQIDVVDDLTGVPAGVSYTIRAAATLNSVFGATNTAGLATGFFGPGGADVIYVPNGSGFATYYYDSFQNSWCDAVTTAAVNGAVVPLSYADGLLIASSGSGATSLTVSGEVKTEPTATGLAANAFNYLSSVAPASQTLATALGTTNPPNIDQGFFGPGGADVVYVPTVGGFATYYYDSFQNSWCDAVTTATVNPASVSLASGLLISNAGNASQIVIGVPSFYGTL